MYTWGCPKGARGHAERSTTTVLRTRRLWKPKGSALPLLPSSGAWLLGSGIHLSGNPEEAFDDLVP